MLRLGAYQLLYLDRVPKHAAVDTAVTLGRRIGGASVGGFINAVLRRVAERRSSGQAVGRADPVQTADSLAAEYSHPLWLVERWIERFGIDEAERLLRVNNALPPLTLQPALWSAEAIAASFDAQGIAWHRAPFDAGLVVEDRRPQELPGLAAGAWYVQDPAQALVTRYAAFPDDARIFDACAAPGGKSVALTRAARFLAAADLRISRARRLRNNLDRSGAGNSVVLVGDAAVPPVRAFDAVLLDVPCLGTGVFGRHPDARWRVTPDALTLLASQAARMLRAQAEIVRPGGWLVFSTCSLEPEENEVQVDDFLAEDRRYRRDSPDREGGRVPAELLTSAGDLFLLPHRHGTDGAYAARLRRVA